MVPITLSTNLNNIMKNIIKIFCLCLISIGTYTQTFAGTINATGNLQKEVTNTVTTPAIQILDCDGQPLRSIPATSESTKEYVAYPNNGQTIRFRVIRKENPEVHIVDIDTSINNISYNTTNGSFSVALTRLAITPSRYNYVVKVYVGTGPGTFESTPASEREYTLSNSGGAFPIGSVIAYMGNSTTVAGLEESGWFKCDGRAVSSLTSSLTAAERNALTDIIGNNLPDMRGQFLRGVDEGRGWDDEVINRTGGESINVSGTNYPAGVRSEQAESMRKHTHSGTTSSNGSHTHQWNYGRERDDDGTGGSRDEFTYADGPNGDSPIAAAGAHTHTFTTGDPLNSVSGENPMAGVETRPDNIAVYWLIRGR